MPPDRSLLDRRAFLALSSLAGAAALMPAAAFGAAERPARRFPIIAFSKPFRSYNAADTARLVEEIGWDGIECPVRRSNTQVAPERMADDLPPYVEELKKRGRELSIVTSDITAMNPQSEKMLRTLSQLSIRRVRLGFWQYQREKSIAEQLASIAAQLKDIATACGELGIQAGFQNHSGADYVGAPVWDVWSMIKDLEPSRIGYCFDIGHATAEGGLAWPTHFRLAESRLTAAYVKDFRWEKGAQGWQLVWCPLGEGMVQARFFKLLAASDYRGPISQHHEYDHGTGEVMIAHFKKDLATLRQWLPAD